MVVTSLLRFFYNQIFVTLPVPTGSYAGQTVVITGSNVGLGKEAARHFAHLGASTLILAVRSIEKGEAAKADIEATTACEPGVIQVWELDMSSYASVKAFAARVERELPRVDIFIENAGINTPNYVRAEENESTITVNVVSTFLLAALVLPKLKDTAAKYGIRPVLSIVGSEVHAVATFPERKGPEGKIFDTLSDEARWDKMKGDRYLVSKLLVMLAIQAIGERYPADSYPVTINCVNPGLCSSNLSRNRVPGSYDFQTSRLARTTEHGSRALVNGGSQGPSSHGRYVSNCAVAPSEGLAAGKERKVLQDKVWKELTGKLESIQPGVTSNI